jgi:hypothetical protein
MTKRAQYRISLLMSVMTERVFPFLYFVNLPPAASVLGTEDGGMYQRATYDFLSRSVPWAGGSPRRNNVRRANIYSRCGIGS